MRLRLLVPPNAGPDAIRTALEVDDEEAARRITQEILRRIGTGAPGYEARVIGGRVYVRPLGERVDRVVAEPLPVRIRLETLDGGEAVLELKPGAYRVGRLPEDVARREGLPPDTVAVYDDEGRVYGVLGRGGADVDHAVLYVGDDGVKLHARSGVGVVKGDGVEEVWGETVPLEPGTILDIGGLRLHVTEVDGEHGSIVSSMAEPMQGERSGPGLDELVSAAEEVAAESARAAMAEAAALRGEGVRSLNGRGYTKLFMFIYRYRDVLATRGLGAARPLRSEPEAAEAFRDAVAALLDSVVEYRDGRWVKASSVDPEKLSRALLESRVFVQKMSDIARALRGVQAESPDPVAVMRAYADVIRLAGMAVPALVARGTDEALDYVRRMDALFSGEEQPRDGVERIVVEAYRPYAPRPAAVVTRRAPAELQAA